MAGYLESFKYDNLSKKDMKIRLNHLTSLMYLAKSHDWGVGFRVPCFCSGGNRTWTPEMGDDFSVLERRVVRRSVVSGKRSSSSTHVNSDRVFCKAFQSGKCSSKSTKHKTVINGKDGMVNHICAPCLIVDKVQLEHSESSSDCKYFGKSLKEIKSTA